MNHVEETVEFYDDDAVSVRMTFCLDKIDSIPDLLARREVVVRAVRKFHGNEIRDALKLVSCYLVFVHIDFCVREGAQLSGMIGVFMCKEDFCDLLRFVAQSFKSFHIA